MQFCCVFADEVNSLWELEGKAKALTSMSAELKQSVSWTMADPDTLGKYPNLLQRYRKELQDTKAKIEEHKNDKKIKFREGNLSQAELEALTDVIAGLGNVEAAILKDIHNT